MIVIPMAGASSRFFKAGYEKPKYMLEAKGKTIFEYSVESFRSYYKSEKFLFVIRDVCGTFDFVMNNVSNLGIEDYDIVVLKEETRGQAETVAYGLGKCEGEGGVTIFNIDTFRPEFRYPNLSEMGDGYLEVFEGTGNNWSFVKPFSPNSTRVVKTTEKNPISSLCCTGLYYFSSASDFIDAYDNYVSLSSESWEKGELYVAPMYNYLIKMGKTINYHVIDRGEVVFCGVPEEYEMLK